MPSLKQLNHRVQLEKVRDFSANTASAAEWLADFIATTIRAESRYFANLAVSVATERLTGYRNPSGRSKFGDNGLDPLEGVSADPEEPTGIRVPVMKNPLAK